MNESSKIEAPSDEACKHIFIRIVRKLGLTPDDLSADKSLLDIGSASNAFARGAQLCGYKAHIVGVETWPALYKSFADPRWVKAPEYTTGFPEYMYNMFDIVFSTCAFPKYLLTSMDSASERRLFLKENRAAPYSYEGISKVGISIEKGKLLLRQQLDEMFRLAKVGGRIILDQCPFPVGGTLYGNDSDAAFIEALVDFSKDHKIGIRPFYCQKTIPYKVFFSPKDSALPSTDFGVEIHKLE
jgi:hypothetical protein